MQRRAFLQSAAALGIATNALPPIWALSTPMPVVDAHIHLFDPTRTGGVPWPEKTDTVLYHPALPPRYERLAEPHGVVGIISPWNYPFSIPATETLAALVAGNAVVLKPSELTPLVALDLALGSAQEGR